MHRPAALGKHFDLVPAFPNASLQNHGRCLRVDRERAYVGFGISGDTDIRGDWKRSSWAIWVARLRYTCLGTQVGDWYIEILTFRVVEVG